MNDDNIDCKKYTYTNKVTNDKVVVSVCKENAVTISTNDSAVYIDKRDIKRLTLMLIRVVLFVVLRK